MQTYDLLMLVVIIGLTLFGAWKGLAWQLAYLASIFASFIVAVRLRGPVAAMIDAEPPWNTFVAMLILYLGSSLAIWIGFRLIKDVIERVRLKEFDHQAGAVVGLGRGVLWCVIITLFALTLLGEQQQRQIIESRSGHYIAVLLDKSKPIMPAELDQVLGPYLRTFDSRLTGREPLPGGWTIGVDSLPFSGGQSTDNRLPPANIFRSGSEPSRAVWPTFGDEENR
jgi:membrane protein required for colicin V production